MICTQLVTLPFRRRPLVGLLAMMLAGVGLDQRRLGGYAVVDLTSALQVSRSTAVQLRVANLFDRAPGRTNPGRRRIGVR